MNVEKETKTYTIDNTFFDTFTKDENTEIFTIYVNRPFDIPTLHSLHKISSYTVMADGAVNRFHDRFTNRFQDKEIIPNAIIGDFDSIREDVLEYYKGKGVMVGQNPSQDNSDLEKCLNHLDERLQNIPPEEKRFKSYRIVVAGGLGGRLDHTLNNIHLVHKFSKKYSEENLDVCLMLLDNNSIGTCILPGKTKYIRAKVFEKEKGCGFFPFLGEVQGLITKGLRWNVDEYCHPLNFEKFISSSNEIAEDVVEFETNKTIFWTTTNNLNEENFE